MVPFRTVYQGIGPGMEVGPKADKKRGRENQPHWRIKAQKAGQVV